MKSTVLLALVGLAAAQTATVVDLFLLGFDGTGLVGSVIASDASATTYSVTCAASTTAAASAAASMIDFDSSECGVPDDFTITQGPATVAYTYSYTDFGGVASSSVVDSGLLVLACDITSSTIGVCSATGVDVAGGSTDSEAQTVTASGGSVSGTPFSALPVTITAGLAAQTGSTAAQTGSSTAQTGSSTAKTGSNTSSSSSKGSSATHSGAGMPMITMKAQWVMGGAAAVALAAL